jgi:hypothetical protein
VFVADATGILNVCVLRALEILKSVPVVPVAKLCEADVSVLRVVITEPLLALVILPLESTVILEAV